MAVEHVDDSLSRFGYGFPGSFALPDQCRSESVKELCVSQFAVYLLTVLLVEVAENIITEVLDLSYDVPALVVVDIRVDVLANPLQLLACRAEILYHLIDSLILNIFVVKANPQAVRQVELVCKIPENSLEECVNCLDMKVVVVVHEQAQCLAGTLTDNALVADARLLLDGIQVAL